MSQLLFDHPPVLAPTPIPVLTCRARSARYLGKVWRQCGQGLFLGCRPCPSIVPPLSVQRSFGGQGLSLIIKPCPKPTQTLPIDCSSLAPKGSGPCPNAPSALLRNPLTWMKGPERVIKAVVSRNLENMRLKQLFLFYDTWITMRSALCLPGAIESQITMHSSPALPSLPAVLR